MVLLLQLAAETWDSEFSKPSKTEGGVFRARDCHTVPAFPRFPSAAVFRVNRGVVREQQTKSPRPTQKIFEVRHEEDGV